MLGLRFYARAFSSCGKRGPLFIAVRGPLVAEHRLQTLRLQTLRLSNCGSRAQLLRGMWDLPRPGLEPVSPALAGRLSTTAPPGKPLKAMFYFNHEKTVKRSKNGWSLEPLFPDVITFFRPESYIPILRMGVGFLLKEMAFPTDNKHGTGNQEIKIEE